MVIACPMPDWGLFGATTKTLPNDLATAINSDIPLACIPSSFVTNITLFISLYESSQY